MKTSTLTQATRRILLAAAVTTTATLSAMVEDWTVDADTTLTEDMTVDALTVDSGVTLDLAGYSLTCTSLAGEGTITSIPDLSGYSDLTKPDGTFTMATPTTTPYRGTVGNLFNNNTYYSQGTTDRILLNSLSQNLPLRVDYDFGDGNAKVVNAYKIYAATKARAPGAWVLYGSNDSEAYGASSDDGWTAIKEETDDTWTHAGTKNTESECHSYTCYNTTAYRYYRLKFTATNGDESYFEMVQLEYFNTNPGELHLNVESGSAAWPASIRFTGNIKVVKEGAGILESAGELNMNGATFVIATGTVQSASTFRIAQLASDKAVNVTVAEGGTLHSGGILAIGCGKNATLTVNGGTVYSGGALRVGNHASSTATLNLNSGTVEVKNDQICGLPTGGSGVLNLNGGTLKTRRLFCNSAGNGTLNFNRGTLKANARDTNAGGLIHSGVTVNVGENGGAIDSGSLAITVGAAIGGTGAMRFKGGSSVTLSGASNYTGGTTVELGTKIITSNETAENTILGNLAVDGVTYTEDTPDIPVFQYTSDLTDPDDLAHVSFLNCGEGTAAEISGTQILVDFVAPAWELDADHLTWSSLVAKYGAPASDARVIIKTDTAYTLTIDQDATIGELVFTGSGSVTLAVESGNTLTTDDIAGVGGITNNGTIVKTGAGTVTWPFDNDSTGTTTVSAGILKAQANAANSETNQTVRVKSGATFDVNGYKVYANVILEGGARFMNSRANLNYNTDQTVSITLEGDATVTALYDCGLIQYYNSPTALNLGAHTLTLDGSATFRLSNTTITGTGTINVTSGTLTIKSGHTVTGNDCTLTMGSGTTLTLGDHLSVSNFTNSGTISNNGTLTVTGTLTPGNEIPRLTLSNGATVKATGPTQTVSTAFSVSGSGTRTITIDASEIDAATLRAGNVPVLTVPLAFDPSGVTWEVSGAPINGTRAKWVTGETTKTLYLARPTGLMLIFR